MREHIDNSAVRLGKVLDLTEIKCFFVYGGVS